MIREKLIKIIGDVTPLAFFYGFKTTKNDKLWKKFDRS